MKSHKENQERAKQFTAEQKQQMMNESLNTLKKDNNVSDIDNLKSFDYDGYRFHEELSSEKDLIFTR